MLIISLKNSNFYVDNTDPRGICLSVLCSLITDVLVISKIHFLLKLLKSLKEAATHHQYVQRNDKEAVCGDLGGEESISHKFCLCSLNKLTDCDWYARHYNCLPAINSSGTFWSNFIMHYIVNLIAGFPCLCMYYLRLTVHSFNCRILFSSFWLKLLGTNLCKMPSYAVDLLVTCHLLQQREIMAYNQRPQMY